jgi:hypothetical protein
MNQILVLFAVVGTAIAYHDASHAYEVKVQHHHVPIVHHAALPIAQHYDDHQHYAKDYYHYPAYKFEYGVNDPHTHDHKSQWEVRDGDVVKGEYTLDEADGTKRVVKYTADDKHGFNAHVERIGHASHQHYAPAATYHHSYAHGLHY